MYIHVYIHKHTHIYIYTHKQIPERSILPCDPAWTKSRILYMRATCTPIRMFMYIRPCVCVCVRMSVGVCVCVCVLRMRECVLRDE